MGPSRTPAAVRHVHEALAPARRHLEAHDADTLACQVALAQVAAPTGLEQRRAEVVRQHLAALDLRPAIDAAGNVVGRRDGARDLPPVVVCAHLDTVFDADTPVQVARTGRRYVGPGIGDNARGLAGMVALAQALQATHVRTRHPILFVATTGEEGNGNLAGARHLFATAAARAHAAIALDGPGDERVVTHALGTLRYRVDFAGPGGHSWADHGRVNPVHAAASFAAQLAAWPLPLAPRTTLSVNRIGGGTTINAIPASAWLEVDLRSTAPRELDRLDEDLHALAARVADSATHARRAGSGTLTVQVTRTGHRPSGAIPADAFLATAAFEATRLIGRTPDAAIASTDANIPMHLGIPAIALGAGGRGGDVHTAREWFENRDGALGLARALTILVAVAELA